MGNKQAMNGGSGTIVGGAHKFSSSGQQSYSIGGGGGTGISNARMNRRTSEFRARQAESLPSDVRTPANGSGAGGGSIQGSRRRSSSAAVLSARQSNSIKPKRLSPRQCHLIIKSWSKKVPKGRMAKEIFSVIFTETEELKGVFGIDESVKGKKMRTDPKFIAHCTIFTDTFDFVIRNLDDFSMVAENVEQLGRRHASLPLQAESFRVENWMLFTECIVDQAAMGEDKETRLAWRQLVILIIYYMRLGYERETLRMTRTASIKRCSPLATGGASSPRSTFRECPQPPPPQPPPLPQNEDQLSEEYPSTY